MKTKAFMDAPDAPNFSLTSSQSQRQSPVNSIDSITASVFDEACEQATKQFYMEALYRELCKYSNSQSGKDTRYHNKQIPFLHVCLPHAPMGFTISSSPRRIQD